MKTKDEIVGQLMALAARRAMESRYGWWCRDCTILQEAVAWIDEKRAGWIDEERAKQHQIID